MTTFPVEWPYEVTAKGEVVRVGAGGTVVPAVATTNTPAANSAAIKTAIERLPEAGGQVLLPFGQFEHNETIVLPTNVELIGSAPYTGFLDETFPCALLYTGAGVGVEIVTGATGIAGRRMGNQIANLALVGTKAKAGSTGLYLNGRAGEGAFNPGIFSPTFENMTVWNYPTNFVRGDGLLIDVLFRRCRVEAKATEVSTASHLCNFEQTGESASRIITQLTFEDCVLSHTANNENTFCVWGIVKAGALGSLSDLRMVGGTVTSNIKAAEAPKGSSGVLWRGSTMHIDGTHFEGLSKEQTNIGIVVGAALGGYINPSFCNAWGTGVTVGDAKNAIGSVGGTIIAGVVEGNTKDIVIVKGGIRPRTVLMPRSAAVVTDERLPEGAPEVSRPLQIGEATAKAAVGGGGEAETVPNNTFHTSVAISITFKAEASTVEILVGGKWFGEVSGNGSTVTVQVPVPAGKAFQVKKVLGGITGANWSAAPLTRSP